MKKSIVLLAVCLLGFATVQAQYQIESRLNVGPFMGIPLNQTDLGFLALAVEGGLYFQPKNSRFGGGIEYTLGSLVLQNARKFRKLELQGNYKLKEQFRIRLGYLRYTNTTAHLFYYEVLPTGATNGYEVNDVTDQPDRNTLGAVRTVVFSAHDVYSGMQFNFDWGFGPDSRSVFYADVVAAPSVQYRNLLSNSNKFDEMDPDPKEAVQRANIDRNLGFRLGYRNVLSEGNLSHNFSMEIGFLPPSPQLYWSLTYGINISAMED